MSVPRFIRLSGRVKDDTGKPLAGITGITLAVYSAQEGGAPLFLETQNVQLDAAGRFTVLLGATKSQGLPMDIFDSAEARWIGVQPSGQAEQPRILLVSVPYALKAADAETLGGLPVTAFVLAQAPAASNSSTASSAVPNIQQPLANALTPSSPCLNNSPTTDGSAITNSIALFTTPCSIESSVLMQSNSTTLQLPATGTATNGGGFGSNALDFQASSFDSGGSVAVNQDFLWKAEPVGNNTASASGSLNLLFGSDGSAPAETGFSIASNGLVTFATGQTFPGTGTGNGTVTTINTGQGLTGGPIASSGTISIDTNVVPQLGASINTFTGSISASSFGGNGASLTNLNPANLSSGSANINVTGNATTATAASTATSLAAPPTQCGSNLFATGITAGGNANCSQPAFSQLSGSVGGTQLSGTYSKPLTLTSPLAAAGVTVTPAGQATATQAFNSNPLDVQASSFNIALSHGATYTYRWQAEPTGNNTSNTAATLNLLFGIPVSLSETGVSIDRNGNITAPLFNGNAGQLEGKLVDNAVTPSNGQVLAFSTTTGKWEPTTTAAGGTITGVTAGTNLTGGGTSGNVTLNLNTAATDARYAQLSAANTFTGNQSLTGTLTATGSVTAPLFNGNAGQLEGKLVDNAVTPSNGQMLAFSTTTGKWEPTTAAAGGTITGVTAGTGLTGGGTSGNVTLNLNTATTDARYAQLSAANTFTGNQSVTGTLTATGAVTAPLFNGNAGAIEGKVVATATPTDGQVLTYKSVTGQWGPTTTAGVLVASSFARFTPTNNSFCSLTICNNAVAEALFQVYFPRAATFSNLYARASNPPGAGNSITVTLKTCTPNASTGICVGVARTLKCTISGATGAGSHDCQDVADSVSVNAGDLVDWTITTTGTPASTALNIAAQSQ